MHLRKAVSVSVAAVIVTLLAASMSYAKPNVERKTETGADTRSVAEIMSTWTPEEKAQHAREKATKEKAAREYAESIRAQKKKDQALQAASVSVPVENTLNTPNITQSLPQNIDTWATTDSTKWTSAMWQYSGSYGVSKTPVDRNARKCAHCGTTSVVIVLRWEASRGMANMSDARSSTGDKQAIFDFGVGWKNGAHDTNNWHIQTCCENPPIPFGLNDGYQTNYLNDTYMMLKVLDDRMPSGWYMLDEYSDWSTFADHVVFNTDQGYPLIISANLTWLPYLNREHKSGYGHNLVVDGYRMDEFGNVTDFHVNDPNDCSANASPGKHWVDQGDLWNAMLNGPSNSYLW